MNARLPGSVCRFLSALEIDGGTLCRGASPVPGSAGMHTKKSHAPGPKPARVYYEHRGAVEDPMDYVEDDVYLNDQNPPTAQCVELVKQLAGAPRTGDDNWQKGESLTASNVTSLEVGTPVASGWSAAGFYPRNKTGQHAGIFAGPVSNSKGRVVGFTLVEQFSTLDRVRSRTVYFDPVAMGLDNTYFYRAGDYATIKW